MKWTVFTMTDEGPKHYGTYATRDDADAAAIRMQVRGIPHGMCPTPEWELSEARKSGTI